MFYAILWHTYVNSLETVLLTARNFDIPIFSVTYLNTIKCTEQRNILSSSARPGIWLCHHEEVCRGWEDVNTAVQKSLSTSWLINFLVCVLGLDASQLSQNSLSIQLLCIDITGWLCVIWLRNIILSTQTGLVPFAFFFLFFLQCTKKSYKLFFLKHISNIIVIVNTAILPIYLSIYWSIHPSIQAQKMSYYKHIYPQKLASQMGSV